MLFVHIYDGSNYEMVATWPDLVRRLGSVNVEISGGDDPPRVTGGPHFGDQGLIVDPPEELVVQDE